MVMDLSPNILMMLEASLAGMVLTGTCKEAEKAEAMRRLSAPGPNEDPVISSRQIKDKMDWSYGTFKNRVNEFGWTLEFYPGSKQMKGVRKSALERDLKVKF